MYALNSALIQMTLRRIILESESNFHAVLTEQRISASDLRFLQMLNRQNLTALDQLPISLFRIGYRSMEAGRGGLDDDIFERATISLSMVMEAISFAEKNDVNPLLSIGFDNKGYDLFRAEPFLKRINMINKGRFTLMLRCGIQSLELSTVCPESKLRDCMSIIFGDYKYLGKNNPKALGAMRDWPIEMMGAEKVATNLLMDGVTPKLVEAHVGLPEKVNSIHRKLRREHSVMRKSGGRIGTHSSAISRLPLHSTLFMIIYLMLAREPIRHINGFAFSRALYEYRQICGHIKLGEDDMLDASEAWLLAAGYRAQEVVLAECRSCKNPLLYDAKKRVTCPWPTCAPKKK